jgi:hypothetical protein
MTLEHVQRLQKTLQELELIPCCLGAKEGGNDESKQDS